MSPFELAVRGATMSLATAIEATGATLIAFAVARAVVLALGGFRGAASPEEQTRGARTSLGAWLSFALELEVAADILRTAIAPSWNEIGQLAAVVALRTILNAVLRAESARSVSRLTLAARGRP
jgi:uncharacterized membrane protein